MAHSNYFPDCFYRVTVKGLYVENGRVLLGKEGVAYGGKWGMPGGGLDFGEDILTALKREIKEEMGLDISRISHQPLYILTHRYENNTRNIGWYYSCCIVYRITFHTGYHPN